MKDILHIPARVPVDPEPTEGRRHHPGDLLHRHLDSPVGALEIVAGPAGLRAVLWPDEDGSRVQRALTWLGGRPAGADPTRAAGGARSRKHLDRAERQLVEYFAGTRREFDLELDAHGTDFQLRVWAVLRSIPYGRTMSYGEQARALGSPGGARAVGAANGRNPLSIVVPCHRVIASSGDLTGFAGGSAAKAWLLAHEQAVLAGG